MDRIMLLPSLDCPAGCTYCFGPRGSGIHMPQETLDAVLQWVAAVGSDEPLVISFHGGEPLAAGEAFYHRALPALKEAAAPRQVCFTMQSNLWGLTDRLCRLFAAYDLTLGTSLDGPEPINDVQRGAGYFSRTMAGIERARHHSLEVGVICTFGLHNLRQARPIFEFFRSIGLDFSLHAVLPSLQFPHIAEQALSPQNYGELLSEMLDIYLDHPGSVRIPTLDALCRSVSARQGGDCVFSDCLGNHLAVDPAGGIYPCQRFCGLPEWRVGTVGEQPAAAVLSESPVWQAFSERQRLVEKECRGCIHFEYCRGGCPYNVLAANSGNFPAGRLRDPYCEAYRAIFDGIIERALVEVFSDDNLQSVIEQPDPQRGLLRRGRLISLMQAPRAYEKSD